MAPQISAIVDRTLAAWRVAKNIRSGWAACAAFVGISVMGLAGARIWAEQNIKISLEQTKRSCEKTKRTIKMEDEKTKRTIKMEDENTIRQKRWSDVYALAVATTAEGEKKDYKLGGQANRTKYWHDLYVNAVASAAKGEKEGHKLEEKAESPEAERSESI